MNNTTTSRYLTTIVAIFMAATLVVGIGIFATTQSAYAYSKKNSGNGNGNGNTVTIEECKNKGSASGFDTTTNQECENLICTHPGENATCTEEEVTSALPTTTPTPTPTPTPTTIQVSGQGEGETFCPGSPIPIPLITSIT